jgi:hypothetical protein
MPELKPSEFYEAFVVGNYEDWKEQPNSIRRAFNVAVSAFHLADHYWEYFQRRSADFSRRYSCIRELQDALVRREPFFKVIHDVAIAYKHLYPRAKNCSILSGGAIVESVQYEDNEITEIKIDYSELSEKDDVIIHHKDGTSTKFSEAIENVKKLWEEIIFDDEQPAI